MSRKKSKVTKKPAKKVTKKRRKEFIIPMDLPEDVVSYYRKVAKNANVSLNTVLKVVVMLEVTAQIEYDKFAGEEE